MLSMGWIPACAGMTGRMGRASHIQVIFIRATDFRLDDIPGLQVGDTGIERIVKTIGTDIDTEKIIRIEASFKFEGVVAGRDASAE